MMVASHSFQQLVRLLALCIVLTSFSCEVSAMGKGGGKGRNTRSRYGRYDDTFGYNSDPVEDNVESPPVVPSRLEPTEAPSTSGKPSQTPTCPPHSESPSTTSPTTVSSPPPSTTSIVSTFPTVAPSSFPSISAAPSQSPAPTISSAPSQSAAPSQSEAPSVSASPSVSVSPTGTATPTLSFAPTVSLLPVEVCATNPDGFFGDATNDGVVVSYGYELEYKLKPGETESDVVANLENSFNNFLLPFLFPADCPTVGRRVLVVHRRLETVGVSKRPDDQPLPGVTCAQKSDENECVVMDGQLTIYTDNGTPSSTEEDIQNQLKKGMDDGDFVEGPVVRVSYVDLETDPNSNENGGNGGAGDQGTTSRRGTAIGVVAAIASFLILALAIVWRRKKQQNENDTTLDGGETAVADA